MNFFSFFKKSKTKDLKPEESKKSGKINIDNIKGLILLTLKDKDANALTKFVDELSENTENEFIDEGHIFNSQQLIDYIYEENIWFYGFFDWKDESEYFDDFIKNALQKNFSLKLKKENICNLNELVSHPLFFNRM